MAWEWEDIWSGLDQASSSDSGGGFGDFLGDVLGGLGGLFTNDDGGLNLGLLSLLGSGAVGALGGFGADTQPVGYQGGIPKYTATRTRVGSPVGTPRPGDPGRRYFSDVQYTPTGQNLAAGGLASIQRPVTLAGGGMADAARSYYLGGRTDGMADRVPASIEGTQPAQLSDGEFVVPADVVSHLGNGNSNAGAERLYEMLDRVRRARTGREEQGRQIQPERYMPR